MADLRPRKPPQDEIEAFLDRAWRRARTRLAAVFGAPLLVLLGCVCWSFAGGHLQRWWRGEVDYHGDWRYEPPYPVDPGRLAAMDLRAIHEELIPIWAIGHNRGPLQAARAYKLLRIRLTDPNLQQIAGELHRLAHLDLGQNARRIFYLIWAWNEYLDRRGQPWRMECSIRLEPRQVLYLKTYYIAADVRGRLEGQRYRARLLHRRDGTNVVERFMGHTSDHREGALLVVDRIHDFAVDRVWPLLDSQVVPRDRLDHRFGHWVRDEAGSQLGPRHLAALQLTAGDRFLLLALSERINKRRGCGSRFGVYSVPYYGFSPRLQEDLLHAAMDSSSPSCPPVTLPEAGRLASASRRLKRSDGLDRAVAALTAWVSRGVAVHELRHAADDRQHNLRGRQLPCWTCPAWEDRRTVAELSAYLASFASPGSGYVHLYQACVTARYSGQGPSAVAIRFASWLLGDACRRGPPAELYQRAARLERRLFGHHRGISLPRGYPVSLPLPW